MNDLRYIEQQLLQYQAQNSFGESMSRIYTAEITPNTWDRDNVNFSRGQGLNSWIYTAVLKIVFHNSPMVKPPYMIMHEAEVNGVNVIQYNNVGEAGGGQGVSTIIENPIFGFSRELSGIYADFFTMATIGFSSKPTGKYKLRVYSPYPMEISIVFEGVPSGKDVVTWM